jgi:acetyl-CoA carboxylase beta subunit
MQLAKTVAATERLRMAGVPFVSIMSDPTTGGVFASFAALGDVNLAEPNALIGFAGARVNAGTIGGELPDGFQRAEFLFRHGFVDRVVHRSELRGELAALLAFLEPAAVEAIAEPSGNGTLPAFRPLSFLTALADKVIPEGDVAAPGAGGSPVSPTAGEERGRG